ncbi:hypothetical protein EPD60_08675 [Flaviaesturariibacter flavus]|uniref:VanZ-like domain-containing protein n=1 Tax=Flaviaesturariibacter flavus TaxID=2502780 RepID=A0A4R1BAR6_9BACT|nr:VanZ family protein [Flaviaesturariibacter flavus]TCJ14076.1 hypothetical protein EPD60_08675 [Flaviaesturariibacter flavus]
MIRRRPLRLSITALYFGLCCYLFLLPGDALPKENWLDRIFFDKWVHIGLFGLLALLCCWCLQNVGPRAGRILLAALCCYGMLVEVVQGLWVPHRSFDLWDFVADAAGAAAGLWLWKRFCRRREADQ